MRFVICTGSSNETVAIGRDALHWIVSHCRMKFDCRQFFTSAKLLDEKGTLLSTLAKNKSYIPKPFITKKELDEYWQTVNQINRKVSSSLHSSILAFSTKMALCYKIKQGNFILLVQLREITSEPRIEPVMILDSNRTEWMSWIKCLPLIPRKRLCKFFQATGLFWLVGCNCNLVCYLSFKFAYNLQEIVRINGLSYVNN